MAHRRKNSHPLCKQKRISAVLDLLSAKSRQEDNKSDLEKVILTERSEVNAASFGNKSVDNKLDIPDDLLKDFLALRSATNLGTADLMRKLIKDYSKLPSGDTKDLTKSAPSDTETLSEYYQEDQEGYVITQNRDQDEALDKDPAGSSIPDDEVPCPMTAHQLSDGYTYLYDTKSMDETVPPNLEQTTGNGTGNDVYSDDEKDGLQVKFQNGAVTIEGTKYNPKIHMDNPETENKGPPPPYPFVSIHGGAHGMMPVVPGGMGPGVPVLPEHVPPEVLAMMNSARINPMISGGISECESLEGNISGCSPTETLQHDKIRNQMEDNLSLDNPSETVSSRLWTPLPSKRPYVHSKKKNLEKGKMKLIAENTSNHGVYTSVLKLPWSKRTRTPKVDTGKHMHFTNLQNTKVDSFNSVTQESISLSTPQQPLQEKKSKKLRLSDQPREIQPQLLPQQPNQPSIVFLPLPTGNIPTSQGIFIPTPNFPCSIPGSMQAPLPVDPHAAAAQSMMMVYPNTNVNSLGKPVRKRGRPPKVPTMTKIVPDEKQAKFDSSYPTFIPQAFPPAAIVLNVNNMLNTGNNVTASNTISNNLSPCDVSSSTTQDVQNLSSASQNQDLKLSPVYPNVQVPVTSASPTNTEKKSSSSIQHNPLILPKPEPKLSGIPSTINTNPLMSKSSSSSEMKMVTTTAMANTSTGALYQEMVLSSKSLVSVRPRRRQSTSEYLRSKSSDQNFICTSFRLRSLSTAKKEKKMSQYVPGMKRRGRPPKKRLENMFEGQMVEVNQNEMEDFNRQNMINLQRIREQREMHSGADLKPVGGLQNLGISGKDDSFSDSVAHQTEISEGEKKTAEGGSDDTQSYSPVGSPDSEEYYDLERGEVEQNEPNEMFHQLFHCKVCNDIVPVEKKDEHYLKHSKANNFCGTCGSVFQRVVCNDANGDSVELLKCENCEQASQNDNQGAAIFCPDCGESFSNPLTLKHHRQLEHPSLHKSQQESFFRCNDSSCGKAFRTKYDLRSHVVRRHDGNQQVFCIYEGCSKKFQNDLHLQEHIKFKHIQISSSKMYKCTKPGCEKEFESERHLNIHHLIHRDEKPMKCQLCDYRCRQQSALVWHVRKHHPEAVPNYGPGSSESSGQEDIEGRERDEEDTQ